MEKKIIKKKIVSGFGSVLSGLYVITEDGSLYKREFFNSKENYEWVKIPDIEEIIEVK